MRIEAPLRLVFIGPPGSGKGTQAQRLRARGFLHLSTGDLLRAEVEAGTPRGIELAPLLQNGALVADHVVLALVDEYLTRHAAEPVVLDGFPRNVSQAKLLGRERVDGAVFFRVPDGQVLQRMSARVLGPDGTIYDLFTNPPPHGMVVTRRSDDTPAVQAARLASYHVHERGLWDYYAAAQRAFSVQADRSRDDVHREVMKIVSKLASNPAGVGGSALDTVAPGPQ